MSSQGREARNFFPQESVGATLSRSVVWLLDYYISRGMRARPAMGLYDAALTLCPLEERFLALDAHKRFMTTFNTWRYHGLTMNYPTDTEFGMAWSEELKSTSPAALKYLDDESYRSDPWWVAKEARL